MKTVLAILSAIAITGCTSINYDEVGIVNDDAVYKLGSNTIIKNVMYQTDDGEWLPYDKPILFPKGFMIGRGPED